MDAQTARNVAQLARLQLTDEQVERFGGELGKILDFVAQLQQLDTDDVLPMTTALDVVNRLRDDQATDGLPRSSALQNAPAADDECFLVPPVLGKV
ncbi:MAG: Asp-tRNA(Asn)/Glu-tRNA(Gln) amidotransferase subunit GatC [Planctomycetota bacterium]